MLEVTLIRCYGWDGLYVGRNLLVEDDVIYYNHIPQNKPIIFKLIDENALGTKASQRVDEYIGANGGFPKTFDEFLKLLT